MHPLPGWAPPEAQAAGLVGISPPLDAERGDGWLWAPAALPGWHNPPAAPETFLLRFPWKRGIFFSPKLSRLRGCRAGSGQGQATGDACTRLPKLSP